VGSLGKPGKRGRGVRSVGLRHPHVPYAGEAQGCPWRGRAVTHPGGALNALWAMACFLAEEFPPPPCDGK